MLLNSMETYVENVRSVTHGFMVSILYPLYPINFPHGYFTCVSVELPSFQNFRWLDTSHEDFEF